MSRFEALLFSPNEDFGTSENIQLRHLVSTFHTSNYSIWAKSDEKWSHNTPQWLNKAFACACLNERSVLYDSGRPNTTMRVRFWSALIWATVRWKIHRTDTRDLLFCLPQSPFGERTIVPKTRTQCVLIYGYQTKIFDGGTKRSMSLFEELSFRSAIEIFVWWAYNYIFKTRRQCGDQRIARFRSHLS